MEDGVTDQADRFDRRGFLRLGMAGTAGLALAGTGGLSALLAACGSSSKKAATATTAAASSAGGGASTSVPPGKYGTLNFQLPWVKNVESAGEFIADTQGIYIQQGFSSVNLIAGGPTATPQETVVQTGRALIGVSSTDATAAAIQKGFNLKVIGFEYQKNPFCIMSMADKPINTPQDMIGKRVGVQSDNNAVWAAFLKANNIDPSKVTKVAAGFDPTPFTQGAADGWFSFITNEPIAVGEKGVKTATMLLADHNYPEGGNVFIVTTDSLNNARDKVLAAMHAEILGWKISLQNPVLGAQLAATKYGEGLTTDEQTLESKAQNALMATGDALTHGLFYVTPDFQAANVKTLSLGGIIVTPSQMFDMSILDELYQDSSLKATPQPVTS
jgi:ABC-type nitrate/sulfonate/bicarbonate transport system substrate-binding protein